MQGKFVDPGRAMYRDAATGGIEFEIEFNGEAFDFESTFGASPQTGEGRTGQRQPIGIDDKFPRIVGSFGPVGSRHLSEVGGGRWFNERWQLQERRDGGVDLIPIADGRIDGDFGSGKTFEQCVA